MLPPARFRVVSNFTLSNLHNLRPAYFKALSQFGPLPAQTVIMIRTAFSFFFAVLLSLVALGAQTAEQDMKDAGQDMKKSAKATDDAAKKTGRAAKKSSKKVVHKSAKKVKEGAAKVEDKTK